jgi:hypothetical protein
VLCYLVYNIVKILTGAQNEESTMTSTKPAGRPAKPIEPDSTGVYWDISPSPSGASILNLHGDLKPGWLGKLSSHLSYNKINMTSGTARKCSSLCWDASFEIDARHCHSDILNGFDPFPAVMAFDTRVELPPLKISDFQMERSTRHGGSIYTEISGKDSIGFLYGVLRIFSFYSLFPTELEISTKGMIAADRFWLKGIGASVPAKEDMTGLYERLQMMLEVGWKKWTPKSGIIPKMEVSR